MALPLTDTVLHQKASGIDHISGRIRKLAKHMTGTMYAFNGVGLAASQVGEPLQMCVIDVRNGRQGRFTLINPSYVRVSVQMELGQEGCLSHPGKFLPVNRHKFVEIVYTTLGRKQKTLRATGFLARVIQHELDHMAGLTIEQTAEKKEEAPLA